jgi:hypothetical protein
MREHRDSAEARSQIDEDVVAAERALRNGGEDQVDGAGEVRDAAQRQVDVLDPALETERLVEPEIALPRDVRALRGLGEDERWYR